MNNRRHDRTVSRSAPLIRCLPGTLALGFSLLLPVTLSAQETASSSGTSRVESTSSDDLGDTIFLSPFEVDASKDAGYKSTNSTSATSLNTPIKEIPMSIEVINKDFLDDTQATNFDEALQYSSGVVLNQYTPSSATGRDGNNSAGANETTSNDRSPSSRGGLGGRYTNAANIRGFNVPFQNRDGFRYGGSIPSYGIILGGIIDTSNVGRMEVVRGPNSLLYGIGVLSGIVNVIPKRPLPEPAYAFSVSGGNYGFMRGTFDATGPLVRDVAGGFIGYRVAGAYEQRGSWTDFADSEKQYYMGQLMFQNDKWNAFIELQYADQLANGTGPQFIYDNLVASIEQTYVNEWGEQHNWTRDVGGAPQSARITGPDPYHSRKEFDVMANVDFTPIENLTLSAGIFLTDATEEQFRINISTLNNQERGLDVKRVIATRPDDPGTEDPQKWQDWLDTYVDIRDSAEKATQPANDPRDLRDFRFVRYWWENRPLTTTTNQARLRAAYSFETKDFVKDSQMKHTFLVGYHYINDQADFVTGNGTIARQFANKDEISQSDPLVERSIYDMSIIRYNGEPLAQPGNQSRHVDVWFHGYYGLYQGSLLNNNLGIIVGARHDTYHARDREYDRFDDEAYLGDAWNGVTNESSAPSDGWTNNPFNANIGFMPTREGVTEYLPSDEPDSANTFTFAANYRITSGLTIYGLMSEGLTPNTGERDGNLDGIASEKSDSQEIGIKFDVFDRKLSGTVSVYRIVRENAIWGINTAPRPVNWVGGRDPDGYIPNPANSFDPSRIVSGEVPLSYGIDSIYFERDGLELGPVTMVIEDPITGVKKRVKQNPDGYLGLNSIAGGSFIPRDIMYLQYDKLDEPVIDRNGDANGKTWRHYIELAFADRGRGQTGFQNANGPDDFEPYVTSIPLGTTMGHSASTHRSASVTFVDEATGVDFQLIYQPLPSWQVIFNYAHTERSPIEPFDLVEVTDPVSGVNFGTEYDQWVRTFGREAFGLEEHDDDGDGVVDRVTKQGADDVLQMGDVPTADLVGGIQGLNLYTGPKDTFSIFTKYSFLEGPVKGFESTLGVTYTGPAATSVAIGGWDLAENRFGTPPTPERWNVNLGFIYKFNWNEYNWDVRLNINNLLDDQKGESFVEYENDLGEPVYRRTVRYYTPRNFRLSVGLRF